MPIRPLRFLRRERHVGRGALVDVGAVLTVGIGQVERGLNVERRRLVGLTERDVDRWQALAD